MPSPLPLPGQQNGQNTQDGVTSTPGQETGDRSAQPGSDAIHSWGSAPTALSHQIKHQIPSQHPKTTDWSITCSTEYPQKKAVAAVTSVPEIITHPLSSCGSS